MTIQVKEPIKPTNNVTGGISLFVREGIKKAATDPKKMALPISKNTLASS